MFCDNCGAKVEDNAKFCPNCGNKIVPIVKETVLQQQDNSSDIPSEKASTAGFQAEKQDAKRTVSSVKPDRNSLREDTNTPEWRKNAATSLKRTHFGLIAIIIAVIGLLSRNILFAIIGLVLGIIGQNKARKAMTEGKGMARIAIILAVVALIASGLGAGRTNNKHSTNNDTVALSRNTNDQAAIPVQENQVEEEASADTQEIQEEQEAEETPVTESVEQEETAEEAAEPEETAEPEEESSAGQAEKAEPGAETGAKESSSVAETLTAVVGVRPEIKEFLDSYEAFIDEYIEFMENYDSTDINMLLKYTEFMSKYAEFAEKVDAIEDMDLNDAEALYYAEVTLRASQKMLKVLGQ